MRIFVMLLFIGMMKAAWSITDFSNVDFQQSFKDSERNGGLTPLEMQAILEAHNTFRRRAAKGQRDRLPTAAGLPLLEWDDRLAYEAQLWANHLFNVSSNRLSHPSSIEVTPWKSCGQNLGSFNNIRNMFTIMKAFEVEIDFYTFDTNGCDPTGNYYTCGHAIQLYFEETTHVGCQIRRKSADPSNYEIIVVCNYGRIASNAAPYTKGVPCSACKGSYPFCLDGLCASKKVCEIAGMEKCKCNKKDSECGHGASVDPATCQCTKNCPPEWISPFCKSQCDDGEGMDGVCSFLYTTEADCVGTLNTCAKYCGNCVERMKPIGVAKASNVLGMESYPRGKDCENAEGLSLCGRTTQETCSSNLVVAAACAKTCNRCRMLDGVTNWSKACNNFAKCKTSALIRNACQKLCN